MTARESAYAAALRALDVPESDRLMQALRAIVAEPTHTGAQRDSALRHLQALAGHPSNRALREDAAVTLRFITGAPVAESEA